MRSGEWWIWDDEVMEPEVHRPGWSLRHRAKRAFRGTRELLLNWGRRLQDTGLQGAGDIAFRDLWSELGHLAHLVDWDQLREGLERESRGRIAIAGLPQVGKSTLFNALRGWEVSPPEAEAAELLHPRQEDMGLFLLVDLPPAPAAGWEWSPDPWSGEGWEEMIPNWEASPLDADLTLFLLDGSLGLRPAEYRWFSRLRARGKLLIPVLNKADIVGGNLAELQAEIEQRLGAQVIAVSALKGEGVFDRLVPRMVELCLELALPLGQEIPELREAMALRLIRQAAFTCGLLGAEPVPLLDVPLQLVTQLRLVSRLALLYGYPAPGVFQREIIAALAGSLVGRYLAQQMVKALPLLGWGASGLLAAGSTWLIGRAALVHFGSGQELQALERVCDWLRPQRCLSCLSRRGEEKRAVVLAKLDELPLPRIKRPAKGLLPARELLQHGRLALRRIRTRARDRSMEWPHLWRRGEG